MNKKLLLVSLLLIGMFAVSSVGTVQARQYKNISVFKLHKLMYDKRKPWHNIVIISVSPFDEYMAEHIPGAYWVPTVPAAELIAAVAYLQCGPNIKIIVSSWWGEASLEATVFLSDAGFKNIYNLVGGVDAWMDAGWEPEVGLGPPLPPPCPP